MRTFVLLAVTAALVGCGTTTLERLDGEPASTYRFSQPANRRDQPVVAGMKQFVQAASAGRMDMVWMRLSALTQRALDQRAKAIGRRGMDLLMAPKVTDSAGNRKLYIADPLTAFALRDVVKMTPGEPPMPADKAADGRTIEQTVTLRDKGGREKAVKLRFEGMYWRVHAPAIALGGS